MSPRLNREAALGGEVPNDQIGVSGAPGRSATESALACSVSEDRASAAAIDGNAGLTMAAAKPPISLRRSGRKMWFAMPDADHFPLDKSSRDGYLEMAIFLLRTGRPML